MDTELTRVVAEDLEYLLAEWTATKLSAEYRWNKHSLLTPNLCSADISNSVERTNGDRK